MHSTLPATIAVMFVLSFGTMAYAQQADLMSLDSDGDSKVSLAEFETYASGKLPGFDRIGDFAKAVDADGDGEISKAEFGGRMEAFQKMAAAAENRGNKDKPETKGAGSKKESAATDAAKSSYEKMKKLIVKSDWENASKLMTDKGKDEVVVEQVVSSIGMTQMGAQMPIPAFEDAAEVIEDVLAKYELDKLGIDISSMFKVEMNIDGSEDQDDANEGEPSKEDNKDATKTGMDETSQKILAAVKQSGKRWEIVDELWKAKATSPFSVSPLTGDLKKLETGADGVAYLEVAMVPVTSDNNDGMMFQMVAPPTVIRMIKDKDRWLFDGRDEQRSRKAMEKFMSEQRGMMRGGGSEPRHDF